MQSLMKISVPKPERRTYTQRMTPALAALLFLSALVAMARLHLVPPPALGANAPTTEFSATRARKHVEAIAREPHLPGTPAHTAVREYIEAQLKAAGFEPQIQEAIVPVKQPSSAVVYVTVRNIVARLKGTEPAEGARSLVLAAHYDSVPTGPGASDDGAGVAAVLETLRALQAGPPLKRDVIILITDGEEMGMLGATAFVAEHPWASEAGLFLNFEMRGTNGPAIMFEVNRENGALMREFARAVPSPFSTSLAADIYRQMPNDTDVTAFKQVAGAAYLNVAAVGGGFRYHSSLDDVDHLDLRTLQHMGTYGLGVATHFGNQPLPPARAGDAVWFNAFRWWLVQYPASWAVPLAIIAVLGLLVLLGVGIRRKAVTFRELGLGLLALPLALVLMFGLIWAFMTWGMPNWAPMTCSGSPTWPWPGRLCWACMAFSAAGRVLPRFWAQPCSGGASSPC
ncbi:MAG TPA: M20/M25/M40 family metallo-hydrolase [Symbiobacteriaceae bacterium]|nr:M20/M25/M40 family metallo-hydrolase [Symbiobacteriaceae bacterium]